MISFINRFRGLLAIGVALSHASAVALAMSAPPDYFREAIAPVLMFTGFNYVIGFIVVSGYCIARSCIAHEFSLSRYIVLRITRIYPTLIACTLLAGFVELVWLDSPYRVAVWESSVTWNYFIANLLGLGGFYGQFASFAPSYTVSFELLFYLIWGVAFSTSQVRFAIPISALAGVALWFILPGDYHFALVLFASWLLGAAIAVHECKITLWLTRVPLWAVWLCALVAFIHFNIHALKEYINFWKFPGSLWTLWIGAIFAVVVAAHVAKPSLKLQADGWLGEISYPLFLVHGPVLIGTGSLMRLCKINLAFGPTVMVLMASSFLFAQAVLVFVERPVMKLRKRAPRPKETAAMTAIESA